MLNLNQIQFSIPFVKRILSDNDRVHNFESAKTLNNQLKTFLILISGQRKDLRGGPPLREQGVAIRSLHLFRRWSLHCRICRLPILEEDGGGKKNRN